MIKSLILLINFLDEALHLKTKTSNSTINNSIKDQQDRNFK